MKKALAVALMLVCSASAFAQDEGPSTDLACRATHEISCRAGQCAATPGDSIHVTVDVALASGVGDICTYTYCRDFRLMPAPGDTVDEAVARWTGFTLSASRGSTEEHIGRPAIDYQLSISEDRRSFFLGGAGDGGFSGWSGTCSPRSQD